MTSFAVAPLLREAAELKIEEFDRSKQAFKARYGVGNPRHTDVTLRERVAALLQDIQKLDPFLENDNDLAIIARYVQQAGDDTSVPDSKLLKYEEQLLHKLDNHMNRFEVTSLHMELMKEAMDANQSAGSVAAKLNAVTFDDDFEVVENELEEKLEKFESETFTAKEVDVEALQAYLESLMELNGNTRPLTRLRDSMQSFGQDLFDGETNFEQEEMMWCIMDLLKNDLISDEKKKTLESYIQSPIAAKELLSTLNMKSFHHWNWKNAEKGLPVTARRDAEGHYHITIEEDLVDMLFLQCIAIGWAKKLKECLGDFIRRPCMPIVRQLSCDEDKKREFFLNQMPFEAVQSHCCNYIMPPPPPPPDFTEYVRMPGRKLKKNKARRSPPPPPMAMPPPPPPPMIYDTLDDERRRIYQRDFFMSRLPSQDGCRPKVASVEEVQANLIKTLFAETKLRMAFDSQVGYSVTDFHSLASSLPHQTVLVILKFLGVPEAWVAFFARFLAAKLNMGSLVRGAPDRVLTRACGVPASHGLELLFTEAVMFFAELAVNKKTGLYLYRLGTKCYFVGTWEQRRLADQELSLFSERSGLDSEHDICLPGRDGECFNIGFLHLSSRGNIRASTIEPYAHRIKKQLSSCTTVYGWVRVWNQTIGTYAAHLFGPLAELFGQEHVEAVKAAYKRIFDIIFEGGNLTDHVKQMLRTHPGLPSLDPSFPLEPVIYLPQAFGGLGVKNPFIAFTLARNIGSDSNTKTQAYLDAETEYYDTAIKNWSALKPEQVAKKLSSVFKDDEEAMVAALGPNTDHSAFITKEDLTKHREYALFPSLPHSLFPLTPPPPYGTGLTPCPWLSGLYRALLTEPVDNISSSERVYDDVRRLSGRGGMKRWDKLSPEDKWVLQMYGDECFERFGTLEMWFGDDVPSMCLSVVRGLDDEDDGSDSDMTSEI